MADALDSKSSVETRAGSSPATGTRADYLVSLLFFYLKEEFCMTPQSVYIMSGLIILMCVFLSLLAGMNIKVKNIKLPVAETIFPVSAGIVEPAFYPSVEGSCGNKPIKLTNIKWYCDDYQNKVGEYIFEPVSPDAYKIDVSIKVKVVDDECVKENNGNYEISDASICDSGENSFSVYDLTGCNLIKDMTDADKNVVIDDSVVILGGYIPHLILKSDTIISRGTFGYLEVENGASVTITDKAEIYTLFVVSANKIDIKSHYGNIGDIVQKQTTPVKYHAKNANQLSHYSLPVDASTIVIDDNEYKGIIVDIISDIDYITVRNGTPAEEIPLPKTLKVLLAAGEAELSVKWMCENYSSEEGVYKFIPYFDGFVTSDSASVTEVKVIAASNGSVKTEIFGLPEKTVLTEKKSCANLCVNAFCSLGEDTFTVKLQNVKFVLDETKSKYVIDKASIDSVFDVDATSICAEFLERNLYENGKIEIDSLKIKIDADKTGKMLITDIAGIQTFASDITEINKIKISGKDAEIVIDSPCARISGEIQVANVSGITSINIHPRYINKIRYSSDIADEIVICGVPATEYLNRKPLQLKKTFFANGIPVVIRQDDDGETYVYRANDLSKISDEITCGTVFGGSYKSDIEGTNVTFESGVLHNLYGGSNKGNIYGQAYSAVNGGFVNNDWYGGSADSDYCEKITCVLDNGAVKRNWYGGGVNSSVGVPGKMYADDESAVELYFFDGIFTDFIYGANNACGIDVFGNIRFEMFDGVGLNHKCGSSGGSVYGNVYATIYGGMVEKQFAQQKSVKGYTKIKAYRNVRVCGMPENKFPFTTICDKNKFFYSFFDNDFKLKERTYTRDISAVYSKEGDEDKLVVRFPEIMIPSQKKGNERIRHYTGDGMFLTFPNGQIMLIDTPLEICWETYNRDIEALGIEHIDYFLLTHYHKDHYGCLPKLLESHTVGTFILPNENFTHPYVEGVIPEGANVVRVNMYDTMNVGEGEQAVKITFLNPPFFANTSMTTSNHNPFSVCAVFEYGTSKLMLDADTYDANEAAWIYECPELISDVDVIKPGHHGITTSSRYDFFRVTDPKYVCITNLREYGCHINTTIYMLKNVNNISSDRIFSTGSHGMIKATLNGKKGEATVVTEYVEK